MGFVVGVGCLRQQHLFVDCVQSYSESHSYGISGGQLSL